MARYYRKKRKSKSFLKRFNKVPTLLRATLFLTLFFGVALFIYGPERAFWQLGAKINGLVDPSGYVASFIDPLLANGDSKYNNKVEDYKFGIVADSHSDTIFYPKILENFKSEKVDFIIHLGDFVSEGSLKKLSDAKAILDQLGINYYSICGNHDHNFWPVREIKNYQEIFGSSHYSFEFSNMKGVALNNSSGYLGVGKDQMEWLKLELEDSSEPLKFLFMHVPPYHPFLTHVMGEENPDLESEAREILKLAKESGVDEIFTGHLHSYSRYYDPTSGMRITVVGAAGTDRNLAPSYVLVTVYSDQTYRVQNKFLDKMEN